MARWQRLGWNRGSLLYGGVSAAGRSISRKPASAALERFANSSGRRQRHARARAADSDRDNGAAADAARFRGAKRLRRSEEDESAAALAGEFRVAGDHRGSVIS